MAEISRRAGVGMATLYRNFPGRQELLEALFTDDVSAVCAAAAPSKAKRPARCSRPGYTGSSRSITSKRQVGSELLKQSNDGTPLLNEAAAACSPPVDSCFSRPNVPTKSGET